MKDFIKMVLAVLCGLFIAGFIAFILFFGMIGSLAAGSKPVLPRSGVLTLNLGKFALGEQTQEADPFGSLSPASLLTGASSSVPATIGIWDAVQAINAAAEDPAVKYIFLRADGNLSGVTQLEELRTALKHFRATSGKPVVAYLESFSTGEYYIASVADKIYMTSHLGAEPMMYGVGSQMFFFGDLLKKFGVNVQLIRHGKYKSAGEMYTRGNASPENREQYQRMIDSIWETIGDEIAASRDIERARLDALINGLELRLPQDCVDNGLVDALVDRQALEDKLTSLAVADEYKDIKWIDFADYVEARNLPTKIRQKIAVVYADGEIVNGSAKSDVAGNRFAAILAKVRADSTVKAVVLRVNSPGGSVQASEVIKDELDRLQAVKPVVASYGSTAASGGYWISNNCEKIFSNATTLTGSIGVFGLVPDLSKTAREFAHVGVESVTSHKHGDIMGMMRPLDAAEYGYMLTGIEAVYDRFTTIVSEGRGIPKATVDAIGQGRVWTGADALGINLVDEIGTLEDAIHYAAAAAGDPDLDSWNIKGYPAPMGASERFLDMLSGGKGNENAMVATLRKLSSPQVYARMDNDIRIK
ncbi:protease-4 [Bacteroidales bacterium WCE2004]|nr:protease-4 [Bacteroidales bacterium WCE2004]